MKAQFGEEEDS